MLIPGSKGMQMRKMNAKRTAQMISMLLEDAYTIKQLSETVGLRNNVVREYVNAMRNTKPRLVRVAEWVEGRAGIRPLWVAAYQIASGKDAARPAKKSGAERSKAYRQRKRAKTMQAILGGAQA